MNDIMDYLFLDIEIHAMKFSQAVLMTHFFTLSWAATRGQDTLPQSGSTISKATRNRGIVQRNYQEITKNLTTLVADLKSYTDDKAFEYRVFLPRITGIREKLADIEFAAENMQRQINPIQLNFARRLFSTMVYAADKMKRYTGKRGHGEALVYKVVELNVRILALRNTKGMVDCWDNSIPEAILRFEDTLTTWKEYMNEKNSTPPGMVQLFEVQSENARRKLERVTTIVLKCN